jgi:zinc transport system substrate-binding protein
MLRYLMRATVEWRLLFLTLLLSCLSLPGYALSSSADDQNQIKVVASIEPLALMAKMLLPEDASIKTLVPAGADPHHYALKVSDRLALAEADLVLWVGQDMERFLSRMTAQLPAHKVISLEEVVELHRSEHQQGYQQENPQEAQQADPQPHNLEKHVHTERDLHLWLNPQNAITLLSEASVRLGKQASMASVSQQLTALDTRVRNQLIPLQTMTYGVYHDAYRHFTEHYRLASPVVVAPGIDQRPGARHLYRVRQQLGQAACLLVEADQRNSLTQQLHAATAVPLVTIKPLQGRTYGDLIEGIATAFETCSIEQD